MTELLTNFPALRAVIAISHEEPLQAFPQDGEGLPLRLLTILNEEAQHGVTWDNPASYEKHIQIQHNIVARLMAERAEPDYMKTPMQNLIAWNYWGDDFEHLRCASWWDGTNDGRLLYAAFMYLLQLCHECAPLDWPAKMIARGRRLKKMESQKC